MTVTVCGAFQLAGVNVRLAGRDRAFAWRRWTSEPIVTSAVGWVFSTTVNVAVPPASVVTRPLVGRDRDPGRVVVHVGDRHVGGVQAVVVRVRAGRRGGDDRVGRRRRRPGRR